MGSELQINIGSSSRFDVIDTEMGSCLPTHVVVSVSTSLLL